MKPLLNKVSNELNALRQWNEELENEENQTEQFDQLRKLNFYEQKLNSMNERIGSVKSNLQTSADYESMLEILKKLNYISKGDNILRLKGQVAAIFGSGKELLLTEIIYQNVIDHLTPSEIAAILSSIVFQGKKFDESMLEDEKRKEITPTLDQAKHQLRKKRKSRYL